MTDGGRGRRLLALGVPDVVDHLRDPVGSLAGRSGKQLYAGWIHSYPARIGCHRSDFPASLRQTNPRLITDELGQSLILFERGQS